MRSLKLLVLPALLAAGVMAPSGASALTVGISENNFQMFSDPLFQPLGVKHTRMVVSYNVVQAAAAGDDEINRVTNYINFANAAGVEPLISFEHARGNAAVDCKKKTNFDLPHCRLPTTTEYQEAIAAFLTRFPTVKVISPWNEWNHYTQPTSRDPKRAAAFTDIATKVCDALNRGCKIVVMDVLDQADSAKAKKPTFKSSIKLIKKFKSALRSKRKICGLHNYSDTNRFRDAGTKTLIKAMGCSEIWLTETGGLYDFGSFWSKSTRKGCSTASDCQLKATKYLFNTLVKKNKKIKRLYVYTWFGGVTPRFDAGLVAGGKPRKAYNEVKKRI